MSDAGTAIAEIDAALHPWTMEELGTRAIDDASRQGAEGHVAKALARDLRSLHRRLSLSQ